MPDRWVIRIKRNVIVTAVSAAIAAGTGGVLVGTGWLSHDTQPPRGYIKAPADGATVDGTVAVQAVCGDKNGCAGVQFKADGANIGAEDTAAPFQVDWDTEAETNGSFDLTAIARDPTGNSASLTGRTITVDNQEGEPSPSTAHQYVSADGNDSCTRNASLVTYAAAVSAGNVCASLDRGLVISEGGDDVLVSDDGGVFTSAQVQITSAGKATAVTFWPITGEVPVMGPTTTLTAETVVYQGSEGLPVTLPVVSTAGFVSNAGFYEVGVVSGTLFCVDKTANTFTECNSIGGSGCTIANGGCTIEEGMSAGQAGLTVLGNSPSKLIFRNFQGSWAVLDTSPASAGAFDIEFRDVTNAAAYYIVGCVSDIRVIGGTYGPAVNGQSVITNYNSGDGCGPTDVLIDGLIHYGPTIYQAFPGADVHSEQVQFRGVLGGILRNTIFSECNSTGCIGISATSPVNDLLIENNFFNSTGSAVYAIQLGYSANVSNVDFNYNTMLKGIGLTNDATGYGTDMIGNYGNGGDSCHPGVNYVKNQPVGGAASCGTDNAPVGSFEVVDATGNWPDFDLHLTPGSNAIDKGSTVTYPADDIDGTARYLGAAPDAGAHEKG